MLPLTRFRKRTRFFGVSGPSLALDFVNGGALDPRITFTRASSATYFDDAGTLQSAANNVPRLDYNPATLAARGLLIEEQRTNLLTYSEEFDNAIWTKVNSTITANTIVSPDGTLTGDKLVADATNNFHTFFRAFSFTSGTAYTMSIFAKAGEYQYVTLTAGNTGTYPARVTFDLISGAVASTVSGTGSIQSVGNGWYRCSVSATATATASTGVNFAASSTGSYASYTGDGTSGIFLWGAQLEAGAFPTSYIPTTTTALTRSADVASVNTLTPWYSATEGTLFVEGSSFDSSGTTRLYAFNDGTVNNYIRNGVNGATLFESGVIIASGASTTVGIIAYALNTTYKRALGYKLNDSAYVRGGSIVGTSTSINMPTGISNLRLGADQGFGYLNGYLRRITYYPRRLSNAELQSLTS